MSTVYLAGPITGCSYDECTDWRSFAIKKLRQYDIRGLDPMRAKSYLSDQKVLGNVYDTDPLCSSRGIMTRDHWDCTRCDVILVNLLGARIPSIGTIMEIAWAWDNNIPVVVAMEKEGNIHDHAMVNEATGFRVSSLQEAIETVIAILK